MNFFSRAAHSIRKPTRNTPVLWRCSPAILLLVPALLFLSACSTTKPSGGGGNATTDHIRAVRIAEIKRQAPLLGIPVDQALAGKVSKINLCASTESNQHGSYSCNRACTQIDGCVHAWCRTGYRAASTEYLFVIPKLQDGCINHEVSHELLIRFYNITGHPARSTVRRIDNGQYLTINHAGVIGWRWPALVNWALPESIEIEPRDWNEIKCGTGWRQLEFEL